VITTRFKNRWQPTLTPDYAKIFYPMPFVPVAKQAFANEPGIPGDPKSSLQYTADQLAEKAVNRALAQDGLLVQITDFAQRNVLGTIAGQLDIAISPAPAPDTEEGMLAALCARDLGRSWATPNWRVQLSYRQLVQSRLWTRALGDPSLQVFLEDVCTFERAIRALADPFINETLNGKYLTTWVSGGVTKLREAGSVATPEQLNAVMLASLGNAVLEQVVRQTESAYNNNPNIQRVLPDFLTGQKNIVFDPY
jgi:hypothetical protein